jgi:murein DD-endopeptidase MepM/ murein hydrolase activator NlpD
VIPLGLSACAQYDDREPQLDWALTSHQAATYYTVHVRPGDTLSEIAQRYAVSTASVARLNGITDHDSIYAGQTLRIPAGSRATREAVYADATSNPSRSNPYVPAPQPRRGGYPNSPTVTPAPSSPVTTTARRSTTPAWYKPTPQQPSVQTRPLPPVQTGQQQTGPQPSVEYAQNVPGSPRFAWPVSGRIIAEYGSTTSGERNDGINIAAKSGEPIHAAASGTVTYAGNQLRNYGNLLFIKHDDGYVTAYAHAQNIIVQKGDRVLKGQVVAYVGQTGDVAQPQLHFEIRRDLQPVNPRPLLVASR